MSDVNSIMKVFFKVISKLESRKERMDEDISVYSDKILYAETESALAGKYLDNIRGMLEG